MLQSVIPRKHLANVLQHIARSVQIAHQVAPLKWGLRLNEDSIMLKVGFVEVFQLGRGIDFVEGMGESWFHELLNHDLIPKKFRNDRRFNFVRSPYKNAPNCDTLDINLSLATHAYEVLLPAHESAIRIGARSAIRKDTIRDHSPGVIAFLAQQLGRRVPQPAYTNRKAQLPSPISEELPFGGDFDEGTKIRVEVNRYERDPRARDRCIKHWGITCVACGLSLADRYGPQVTDLVHVHHLKPLAKGQKRRAVDAIRDLRPVCPNCHAVIHSIDPPRSIEEIKKMLRGAGRTK